MMEKSDAGKGHDHSILVAGFDNIIVAHTAAGLGHIFHTAVVGALYVVAKWEEGV